MLSSLQQHILYPSYCLMHELNVAFSAMAPGRFPTAGYTAIYKFYKRLHWLHVLYGDEDTHHYHTLPHEWKCLCTVYIYICVYLSWNTLHMPFICFFHAFSPHLRGVNDLCRFLHELLHALDGRTLFSKRKGCWHQGQHEMSKLQVISFHFTSYPSRCISSSVVSCYFHHVSSSFWCHLTQAVLCEFMRCVSATLCFLLSCLSTNFNHDKFWKNSSFFNTFSVHLVRWVLERRSSASRRWWASCSGCLPKSFKESLVSISVPILETIQHQRTTFLLISCKVHAFQQVSVCHIWSNYISQAIYIPYTSISRMCSNPILKNSNGLVLSSRGPRAASAPLKCDSEPGAPANDQLTTMVDSCELDSLRAARCLRHGVLHLIVHHITQIAHGLPRTKIRTSG